MSGEVDTVDRARRGQVLHLEVEPDRVACGRSMDVVASTTGDAGTFERAERSRCRSCWRAYLSWRQVQDADPRRREGVVGCLTDAQWRDVFKVRCRSKSGHPPSPAEMDLIGDALAQDPDRYRAMDGPMFDATVPFGSGVRYRDLGRTETDLPGTDPATTADDDAGDVHDAGAVDTSTPGSAEP